ncbi:MAG TPA: bifunctional DNA primase/polymerase [Geminicoccaceae bacterium]|nr:bifunctional DNA primase/polymerase [Geminicoccaceae bacterium]
MAKDLPADIDQSMPAPAAATGDRRLGPFHGAAAELRARGLAVVPCGGEDGKVPLIRWSKWTGPPVPIFVEKMIQRFSWANIGIVTGRPSGITLVDCDDDEAVVPLMIRRCGDTPLKVGTHGGGTDSR